MRLDKIANIIYEECTASENRKITVKDQRGFILWQGKAKDLSSYADGKGWLVLEILIDPSSLDNAVDYNKGKIIMVY
jgi:hypothetical protein